MSIQRRIEASLRAIFRVRIDLRAFTGAVALALSAFGAAPAHALQGSCTASTRFQADGGWQVRQPATFEKGTVLASIGLKLPISLTNIRAGTQSLGSDWINSWMDQTGAIYPFFDAATQSVPLGAGSGIGGRLTITSVSSNVFNTIVDSYLPLVAAPKGLDVAYAYLSKGSVIKRLNGIITYYAKYELVVLDPVKYASEPAITASTLASQRGPQIAVWLNAYGDDSTTSVSVGCFKNVDNTLAGLSPPPPLPKDLPTCEFNAGDLSQTVTLNSAIQSQVAAQGSLRSAGAVGEKEFFIHASGCGKGTVYSVYFTDALHTGSQENYLAPTAGQKVGVRLYHSSEAAPITFGPAPTGSTLPPQAPIQYGSSSAAAGASYSMPFTAQYVRMPGADAAAGAVTAMATVTIVYP